MKKKDMSKDLLERFLRYAVIDTMSNPRNITTQRPSTDGQWNLLRLLEKEVRDLGLTDVILYEKGTLIARIPATGTGLPTIGFMAHVDVADDVPGNGVKPRVVETYDGKDIILNDSTVITVADNPALAGYAGDTLVVTDGTTLLGGDDKAGVAAIMSFAKVLVTEKPFVHGEVELIFTTDEETGGGMDVFPYEAIRSEACYTIDGGARYEIETECFNAASVTVTFHGVSYHTGTARGRLVNAVNMAAAFVRALPQAESPEATDGRYGFYAPTDISGVLMKTTVELLLRDFDLDGLKRRIAVVEQIARSIEAIFAAGKVEVAYSFTYYNMAEANKKKPQTMEAVYAAGKELGMPLYSEIIRGGTDGARLAAKGVPCPNLFTGGYNFHSRYEWLALPALNDAANLALGIIGQWARMGR
ncbi:peptidase T [Parasphaerochaeta coccoides]|uniref:Peptidase T n=1 Tax=Parasphaerochaeta coccoides (strain ATCC BAA-1237 / DSM 17374 / SPN1) TaxID=760011 RepID=F4GI66_PARC1|nr:peptidase T [Parasphaerochaeta coccoides]AEC02664.1 peptidase T [Parasphaerochaeta coccoides DSM 17374]